MAEKKFKPPTKIGARFTPPVKIFGTTVPRSLSDPESKKAQRIELAKLNHLLGSETLIRTGSFYELQIEGHPTVSTKLVCEADRPNVTLRLTRFEAEEWGRIHCMAACL